MIIEQFGCIPFGGDYCPEQWDEATWQEDIRLMQELGVNTVTINVHSWVMNQPAEGVFDYSKLDKIVDLLHPDHYGHSYNGCSQLDGQKIPRDHDDGHQ